MGGGSWTTDDWSSYSSLRSSQTRAEIFTSKGIDTRFNPKLINFREARDSTEHPESTPIIIGLDVTGSMGMIAENLAKRGLGSLVGGIYERQPVKDPQILLMGIGDIVCDRAPLQVTQFESDIRIAEQLKDIWLEGGGGGNNYESYHLPWHFAGNYTATDAFDKRGEKGYLFTIGDEFPPPQMQQQGLDRVFSGNQGDITPGDMLSSAQEKYTVFHIIAEEGNCARAYKTKVIEAWRELLGKNVILMRDHNYLSEIVISVLQIMNGTPEDEVISSWPGDIQAEIRYALGI